MPKNEPNRFVVVVAAPAGEAPQESDRRLRGAFQKLRRSHGFKLLAVREVKPIDPAPPNPKESTHAHE